MALEAIKYDGKRLQILNQLLLPAQSVYEDITSVEEAWEAIRTMKVSQWSQVLPIYSRATALLLFLDKLWWLYVPHPIVSMATREQSTYCVT